MAQIKFRQYVTDTDVPLVIKLSVDIDKNVRDLLIALGKMSEQEALNLEGQFLLEWAELIGYDE